MAVCESNEEESLSWKEIKEISAELKDLFLSTVDQDVAKIKKALEMRESILETHKKQMEEVKTTIKDLTEEIEKRHKELALAKSNSEQSEEVHEIEEKKEQALQSFEQMKIDEKLSIEVIESLRQQYDTIREASEKKIEATRKDIPRIRHAMTLYSTITGIKWDYSKSDSHAGYIHVPDRKMLSSFDLDPSLSAFDSANELWDKIDEAYEMDSILTGV